MIKQVIVTYRTQIEPSALLSYDPWLKVLDKHFNGRWQTKPAKKQGPHHQSFWSPKDVIES